MPGQGFSTGVDLVLCIDCTSSMTPILERVKRDSLKLHSDLTEELAKIERTVTQLRIRVIAFRDVTVDGNESLEASPFFKLPQEQEEFSAFVNKLTPTGGGDAPESGLEAIAVALHSDWVSDESKLRHIVVLWTDAPAKPLEEGHGHVPSAYADQVPGNLDELAELWELGQESGLSMRKSAQRLLLYAPDSEIWNQLGNWPNAAHFPSQAGEGLSEVDYQAVLSAVAASI